MATAPPPAASLPKTSPFLTPHPHSTLSSLSILHLRRDQHLPIILQSSSAPSDGYLEGPVTNTRFGSFPHSTLVNQPWGSQIRASEVDTGSRGRKGWEGKGKKRKRGEDHEHIKDANEKEAEIEDEKEGRARKEIKTAASGFVHLLPPTPELWTSSLPHRTQVVYTPDYSYILHRIRARPGSVVIEAGAGSGSFTHAAARAVFNGYPRSTTTNTGTGTQTEQPSPLNNTQSKKHGRVHSFEFHEPRYAALKQEIQDHGLARIVELTHRDVCSEGFTPHTDVPIHADAIFLDLPAPWLALKHLTQRIRRKPSSPAATQPQNPVSPPSPQSPATNPPSQPRPAITPETTPNPALHPHLAVHICTFSPCIEQVTRTISTLRNHGWLEISMVELSAKKLEVRRERVGLQEEGLRGVNASPANVKEAVERLREVEGRTRWFHEMEARKEKDTELGEAIQAEVGKGGDGDGNGEKGRYISKQARLASIASAVSTRKLYKEGRLVHRPEPELKMHTSYLVFAVLPREWSEEDENEAQAVWAAPISEEGGAKVQGQGNEKGVGERGEKGMSKRQRRKEAKRKKNDEGGGGDRVEDEVNVTTGAMETKDDPEAIQDVAPSERLDKGADEGSSNG